MRVYGKIELKGNLRRTSAPVIISRSPISEEIKSAVFRVAIAEDSDRNLLLYAYNGNVNLTVDELDFSCCKVSVDDSLLADFLKGVKYACHAFLTVAGSLGGPDSNTPSTMEMDCGSHRSAGFLAALASYNTTCGEALRFFRRPSLEVEIEPRSLPIQSPERLIPQLRGGLFDTPFEYVSQNLIATGKKNPIYKLASNVRLNGTETHWLRWSRPLRTLDPIFGPEPFSSSQTHLGILLPNGPVQLPIWAARRTKSGQVYLTLNADPLITRNLNEFKGQFVDIDIQFIAENYSTKKPLKYRLNVKSWDELNLTERD